MGFYSNSTLIEDARRHGVKILPVCARESEWDCKVLPVPGSKLGAIRLGFRIVQGLHRQEYERLSFARSERPFASLADFSARVQTIHKETNERYWKLLDTFKQKTGYAVMENTSFNVRGEPPVCTPDDAYKCFMRTEMDYLAVGNYLLAKSNQPEWIEKDDWRKEFKLD